MKITSLNKLDKVDRKYTIETLVDFAKEEDDVDYEYFRGYVNNESSECFVALEDDHVYGFLCVEYFEDSIHIDDIFVDSSERSKGVGKQMIQFLLENHSNIVGDVHFITLEVSNKNLDALVFYIKLNFMIVGFISNYYSEGESAIYMKYKI